VIDLVSGTAEGAETGRDTIAGFEVVLAGKGDDTIVAVSLDPQYGFSLVGGDGNDTLTTGAGEDTLLGGSGNDRLSSGSGRDLVDGGSGNDIVTAALDQESDAYEGGFGEDTLDYSAADLRITFDLVSGTAKGDETGEDTISNFEVIVGGAGDDSFLIGSSSIVLTGGDGGDRFAFTGPQSGDTQPIFVGRITDFTIGDRIDVARYQFSEQQDDNSAPSDLFGTIYIAGENGDPSVQLRFERVDDHDRTIIELGQDDAGQYRYSIDLDGYHRLEFTVTPPIESGASV
jgi:Ca2+-binding RTX toxin-like protein